VHVLIFSKEYIVSNTKIFVGNIPFAASEQDITGFFEKFGEIVNMHRPMDRETGRPRGFAFIEFDSQEAMQAAIAANGEEMQGRPLRISVATSNQRSREKA